MTYRIAWMFPDILFMHGERGNVLALKRFAEEAGYDAVVDRVDFETAEFNPDKYDAIVFGVGEISSFEEVIKWLRNYDEAFKNYIRNGRPMLVTGTSQAIFAKKINRADGSVIEGLGYFPAEIQENTAVYGDDIIVDCKYNGVEMQLVGSQIMMMDINKCEDCDSEASVLGELVYGYGNTGKSREEGYVWNNAIFTNVLGPILICNPWLTMEMIRASASYRGNELKPVDESFKLERASADAKVKFNLEKTTRLTNCK